MIGFWDAFSLISLRYHSGLRISFVLYQKTRRKVKLNAPLLSAMCNIEKPSQTKCHISQTEKTARRTILRKYRNSVATTSTVFLSISTMIVDYGHSMEVISHHILQKKLS